MFVVLQGFCKAALREYQRENPPSEAEEEEEADDEEEDDEDSFPLGISHVPCCISGALPLARSMRGARREWGEMMEKSFRNALGGSFKDKDLVHVDMHEKLNELGLVSTFPSDAWPAHNAVRELATKIKRESRGSGTEFFIAVDLRK